MRPLSLGAARRLLARHQPVRWSRGRPHPFAALGALGVGALTATLLWWPSTIGSAVAALQRETGAVLVEVDLHGATRLDVATVQAALELEPGMPLLGLDLEAARTRLESLGWVEQATVRRQLPGRLVVEVKEHRPIGVWLGPDGPALVAASGQPVEADDLAAYRHLPRLVGAGAPAEAPRLLRALRSYPTLLGRLERLEHLPSGRWRLVLDPGVRIELAPGDLTPQLQRLASLAADGVLDRAVSAVDLRVPDRVVLTPWPLVRTAATSTSGRATR